MPAGCEGVPVIAVADVRRALGDLARAVRARFKGRVVGVTGSNGKTTTKELIAAALSVAGTVLRTQGNLNTDVGLPMTVLESTEEEDFWVLEMAMRARGEIAYLADIGKPHVGVVTNVAGAHLERLGSIEEVARAKGEIFHGLADGGVAVLPADEPLLEKEASHLPEERKLRFAHSARGPCAPRCGFSNAFRGRAWARWFAFRWAPRRSPAPAAGGRAQRAQRRRRPGGCLGVQASRSWRRPRRWKRPSCRRTARACTSWPAAE
jgi:UDP-N-acetylmuramyl pentapeptide synthase